MHAPSLSLSLSLALSLSHSLPRLPPCSLATIPTRPLPSNLGLPTPARYRSPSPPLPHPSPSLSRPWRVGRWVLGFVLLLALALLLYSAYDCTKARAGRPVRARPVPAIARRARTSLSVCVSVFVCVCGYDRLRRCVRARRGVGLWAGKDFPVSRRVGAGWGHSRE